MTAKLLTEHHLEFLSLKGGCTSSSESILVKMPHCWKSHVAANIMLQSTGMVIFIWCVIAPDKVAYCVLKQFREPENAIKFISVRTKMQ